MTRKKGDHPLLSVIVPAFNASGWVESCLKSILSQDYENLEVICIDDGSTDNSREIIERLSLGDNRIKLICKENGGVSSARNRGLKEAVGEYIAFVDSDDTIAETMFSEMISAMEGQGADIAMCGLRIHDQSTGKTRSLRYENVRTKEECILNGRIVASVSNKIFRKSIIDSLNLSFIEGNHCGEDLAFSLSYLAGCGTVSVVHEPYYKYLKHGRNAVLDIEKREDIFQSLDCIFLAFSNTSLRDVDYESAFYKIFCLHGVVFVVDLFRTELDDRGVAHVSKKWGGIRRKIIHRAFRYGVPVKVFVFCIREIAKLDLKILKLRIFRRA